jgi:hypothetical protein
VLRHVPQAELAVAARKIPNGPILTRDAGYVTIYETFDPNTGDLISQTLSPDHGPHPSLADPSLFCDVVVAALT